MGLFDFLSKKPEIPSEILHFNEGMEEFKGGQRKEKMSTSIKALELKSDDGVPFADTSKIDQLLSFVNFTEALASFDKAIAIKPDYAEAWFYRGLTLLELRKSEGLPDNFKVTRNGKELTIVKRKWYSEAIDSFNKVIDIKPDHVEAWFYRGIAQGYLEHNSEAITSFDKAISIKPDAAEVWLYRGLTLGKKALNTEAVASLDRAIAIKPDYAEVWFYRGIILHNLGQYSEALASLDRAVAIDPDYREANQRREEVLREYQNTIMERNDFSEIKKE